MWLQGEEWPGPDWRFLAQIDSRDLPLDVDFGCGDMGVGYAFLSPDASEGRSFGRAVELIWLQGIAARAAVQRHWDLLEEVMQAMCTWDGTWDQWNARDKIAPWLASLTAGRP
ncbi:hypothetical protein ACWDX6_20695 [Streptomyces sp. NPDC003027]